MGGLRRCAYIRCKSTSGGNKSLFKFPIHDTNRLRVWLDNSGNFNISHLSLPQINNKYLCSDHFDKKDLIFDNRRRIRLSFSAVPFHFLQTSIAPVVSESPTPTPSTSQPLAHEGSLEELKVLIPQRIYSREPSGKELKVLIPQRNYRREPSRKEQIRTSEATGVSEETVTIILEKEKSSAKSRDTPKMRSKRFKFNDLFENEDINSDEEESSCESSRNVQKSDAESHEEEEEEQYETIETLKLEFEEDIDHSKYINERKRIEIESTPYQTSTVQNWLPLTQTLVKPEPLDAEEEHRKKLTEYTREYRQKKKIEKQNLQLKQCQQQKDKQSHNIHPENELDLSRNIYETNLHFREGEKYLDEPQHNNSNMEDSASQSEFEAIAFHVNQRLGPVALHQTPEERLDPLKTDPDDYPLRMHRKQAACADPPAFLERVETCRRRPEHYVGSSAGEDLISHQDLHNMKLSISELTVPTQVVTL